MQIPIPVPTISPRESLSRGAWFRNAEDQSYTSVAYTLEDERRPEEGGKVRRERAGARRARGERRKLEPFCADEDREREGEACAKKERAASLLRARKEGAASTSRVLTLLRTSARAKPAQ